MKIFKSNLGQLPGPGGKVLQFDLDKKSISEDECTEIINSFFMDTEGAEVGKELAWNYLKKGKPLIMDDVKLSVKK